MLLFIFNQGVLTPVTPSAAFISASTWFPGIVACIQGAMPEATAIIRSHSMNKENWGNLIRSDRLSLPFVIVEAKNSNPVDLGRDNIVYSQDCLVHYVCSTVQASSIAGSALGGTGYDAAALAESRILNLVASTIGFQGSSFQLVGQYPSYSIDHNSPANQQAYSLRAPIYVATMRCQLIWGIGNTSSDSIWDFSDG